MNFKPGSKHKNSTSTRKCISVSMFEINTRTSTKKFFTFRKVRHQNVLQNLSARSLQLKFSKVQNMVFISFNGIKFCKNIFAGIHFLNVAENPRS